MYTAKYFMILKYDIIFLRILDLQREDWKMLNVLSVKIYERIWFISDKDGCTGKERPVLSIATYNCHKSETAVSSKKVLFLNIHVVLTCVGSHYSTLAAIKFYKIHFVFK